MTRLVSVQRHLIETQHLHPGATGDLTRLLWDLTIAFKLINAEVNKAGLVNLFGLAGEENASGDEVTKLDRFAQDTIVRMMDHGGHLCCMASEEEQEIIQIPPEFPNGKYVLSFDPLDGSSNIDANVSVGTIFAIHRRKSAAGPGQVADVLQSGREMCAAGYVIYGSSTMLVISTGERVDGFTLDPAVGEFLLSHPDIKIPARGNIYSVNEGNALWWDEGTTAYVDYVKSAAGGGPYKTRYIGSMIADIHRTLLYGGIFLYPKTHKRPGDPGESKLRLLYEAAPMGYIVEKAGGIASTGDGSILDITPTDLHQRVPVAVGSPDDVAEYLAFYRGERK